MIKLCHNHQDLFSYPGSSRICRPLSSVESNSGLIFDCPGNSVLYSTAAGSGCGTAILVSAGPSNTLRLLAQKQLARPATVRTPITIPTARPALAPPLSDDGSPGPGVGVGVVGKAGSVCEADEVTAT